MDIFNDSKKSSRIEVAWSEKVILRCELVLLIDNRFFLYQNEQFKFRKVAVIHEQYIFEFQLITYCNSIRAEKAACCNHFQLFRHFHELCLPQWGSGHSRI